MNFNAVCGGQRDALFYTNPANEDAFHPTYTSNLTLNNVNRDSYAFIDRPSLR